MPGDLRNGVRVRVIVRACVRVSTGECVRACVRARARASHVHGAPPARARERAGGRAGGRVSTCAGQGGDCGRHGAAQRGPLYQPLLRAQLCGADRADPKGQTAPTPSPRQRAGKP